MAETLQVKHIDKIVGGVVERKHNVPNIQTACEVLREQVIAKVDDVLNIQRVQKIVPSGAANTSTSW